MQTDLAAEILELLKSVRPESDYSSSGDFVADGLLDSFDLVALVSALDRAYGISIDGAEIVPDNFRQVGAIAALVARHRKKA